MLTSAVRFILKTLFILIIGFNVLASGNCADNYIAFSQVETIYGQEVEYQRVSAKDLKQGQLKAERLNESQAVFVGLNMNGHMYIVADGYRYDYKGRSFFKRAAKRKNSNLLTKGVVIKLDDSTGEITAGIEEFFEQHHGEKAISCIKGSCRAVSHSGTIQISDKGMSSLLPSNFLRNYIVNGIEGSELFVLGDENLASITRKLRNMTNEEIYQVSLHGFLYSGPVIVAVGVALSKLL